jgi:CRAL/TRIO domain
MQDNYPDILSSVKAAPTDIIFDVSFNFASIVMDAKRKKKFKLINKKNMRSELLALFPPHLLPPHMGGTCEHYGELGYIPHSKHHKGGEGKSKRGHYIGSDANNSTSTSSEFEKSLLFNGGATEAGTHARSSQPHGHMHTHTHVHHPGHVHKSHASVHGRGHRVDQRATFHTTAGGIAGSMKYEGLEVYEDQEQDVSYGEFNEGDLVKLGLHDSHIEELKWWQKLRQKMRSEAHKVLGALGMLTMAYWERARRRMRPL